MRFRKPCHRPGRVTAYSEAIPKKCGFVRLGDYPLGLEKRASMEELTDHFGATVA
jgi:hypothetical protein